MKAERKSSTKSRKESCKFGPSQSGETGDKKFYRSNEGNIKSVKEDARTKLQAEDLTDSHRPLSLLYDLHTDISHQADGLIVSYFPLKLSSIFHFDQF